MLTGSQAELAMPQYATYLGEEMTCTSEGPLLVQKAIPPMLIWPVEEQAKCPHAGTSVQSYCIRVLFAIQTLDQCLLRTFTSVKILHSAQVAIKQPAQTRRWPCLETSCANRSPARHRLPEVYAALTTGLANHDCIPQLVSAMMHQH